MKNFKLHLLLHTHREGVTDYLFYYPKYKAVDRDKVISQLGIYFEPHRTETIEIIPIESSMDIPVINVVD